MGLLGACIGAFRWVGLFVPGQVLKGLLEGQDRLGDVVQTEAVGPVPLAGLVLVAASMTPWERDTFALLSMTRAKD